MVYKYHDSAHYSNFFFISSKGCPGCIQAVPCINFQQDLSRTAGLIIGKRMLARIQKTALYKQNCEAIKINTLNEKHQVLSDSTSPSVSTPRRQLRQKRLARAADLVSARKRSIVVGRESWPTDFASAKANANVEDTETGPSAPLSPNGGFLKK